MVEHVHSLATLHPKRTLSPKRWRRGTLCPMELIKSFALSVRTALVDTSK